VYGIAFMMRHGTENDVILGSGTAVMMRWKVVTVLLLFHWHFGNGFSLLTLPRARSLQVVAVVPKRMEMQQSTDIDMEVEIMIPQSESQKLVEEAIQPPSPVNDMMNRDTLTVLGLLWLVAAISALDRVAMSVALVPMSSEFHFTDTMSGSISSLFSLGYGAAILPAGLLVSCISPKQVMGYGLAVWSLATMATPSCAELLPFVALPILIIRALVGMGEAMVIPTIHRLLSVWTLAGQKSSGTCDSLSFVALGIHLAHSSHWCIVTAIAFIYSGFHAGTIGAYLLSPFVLDTLGDWRCLFFVFGALGLVLLGPWLLWAQDAPKPTESMLLPNVAGKNTFPVALGNNGISLGNSVQSTTLSWGDALQSYRNAPWQGFFQSKGTWGMLLAHCAKNWGLYTSLSWTPTFYAEQYDIGVRDSAWLSVMPSVAGAVGGLLAGALADATLRNSSLLLQVTDESRTKVRKIFQAVGLLGPAAALASLAYNVPEQAWVAQLFLMAAVGLQSFNAGGFEAGTQDKAGPIWSGMLYSVTSLPSVMGTKYSVVRCC
jgi:ACS family sodium-dependent inorganic phosphate cotransporter